MKECSSNDYWDAGSVRRGSGALVLQALFCSLGEEQVEDSRTWTSACCAAGAGGCGMVWAKVVDALVSAFAFWPKILYCRVSTIIIIKVLIMILYYLRYVLS